MHQRERSDAAHIARRGERVHRRRKARSTQRRSLCGCYIWSAQATAASPRSVISAGQGIQSRPNRSILCSIGIGAHVMEAPRGSNRCLPSVDWAQSLPLHPSAAASEGGERNGRVGGGQAGRQASVGRRTLQTPLDRLVRKATSRSVDPPGACSGCIRSGPAEGCWLPATDGCWRPPTAPRSRQATSGRLR